MKKKRILSLIMACVVLFTIAEVPSVVRDVKASQTKLSTKKVVITKGKTKTIRLKHAKKTVKWKLESGKKKIKIVSISGANGRKIKVLAKKAGTAVVRAKCGKKVYRVKIKIKRAKKNNKSVVVAKDRQDTGTVAATTEATSETTKSTDSESKSGEVESTLEEKKYATVTFFCDGYAEDFTMQYEIGQPYGTLPVIEVDEIFIYQAWRTEYYKGATVLESDICTGDITLYLELHPGGDIETEPEETYTVPDEWQ